MYLLGSVHLMKPDGYPLAGAIERAYEGSSVTVFEVDLGGGATAQAALQMLAAGSLPDGTTLDEVVSAQTYQLTVQKLHDAGLDPGSMSRMRPWMVATTLALNELQRAGYSPDDGIDRYFHRRARADGKSVTGLETVEFQIGLFAGLSPEDDEAFLRQTVAELETVIPEVDALIGHWKAGRVTAVESLLAEGYEEFPELYRKLVSDRNRSWMPRLEAMLRGGDQVFVVVGALHLIGDGGVVDLLRKRGYTVEQL
jgi:hypothetical protein